MRVSSPAEKEHPPETDDTEERRFDEEDSAEIIAPHCEILALVLSTITIAFIILVILLME